MQLGTRAFSEVFWRCDV